MSAKEINFFQKVYALVQQVPPGMVVTYGQIAAACGAPRASRAVGYALHVNPDSTKTPCHRVVNRHGGLAPAFAFGGIQRQRILLQAEGIDFGDGENVDLGRYRFQLTVNNN